MRLRASYIGGLAEKTLKRKCSRIGLVRHVFANTIYINSGNALIVLTRKGFRAPMNIGLTGDGIPLYGYVEPGDIVRMDGGLLRVGKIEVELKGASIYRAELKLGNVNLEPLGEALKKASLMLSLLYQVSPHGLNLLPETERFKEFVREVVTPFTRGRDAPLKSSDSYVRLLGLGEGFTPSGDDFLSGFIPTINFLTPFKVFLSPRVLLRSTSWASAMLLDYAQRGFVDEALARVIRSAAAGDGDGFLHGILDLARRGHTSGLDISVGAVLAISAVRERSSKDGALWSVLRELRCIKNPY